MAKRNEEEKTDLEECRNKIRALLVEYNCRICTEDYCSAWLTDLDTHETMGDLNPKGGW